MSIGNKERNEVANLAKYVHLQEVGRFSSDWKPALSIKTQKLQLVLQRVSRID